MAWAFTVRAGREGVEDKGKCGSREAGHGVARTVTSSTAPVRNVTATWV